MVSCFSQYKIKTSKFLLKSLVNMETSKDYDWLIESLRIKEG